MILKIDKELFQWEKNRFILLEKQDNEPKISCVQFYNKKSKISIEENIVDGKVKIPNQLLKENLPIVALACIKDNEGTHVITRRTFKVLSRVQPEDYFDDSQSPDEPDSDRHIIYDGGVEV